MGLRWDWYSPSPRQLSHSSTVPRRSLVDGTGLLPINSPDGVKKGHSPTSSTSPTVSGVSAASAFYKGQRVYTPVATGPGLSLSYDIVTQGHGGTLTVESTEGEGATFIVTLPSGKTEPASSA